jgi:hypothetical protein
MKTTTRWIYVLAAVISVAFGAALAVRISAAETETSPNPSANFDRFAGVEGWLLRYVINVNIKYHWDERGGPNNETVVSEHNETIAERLYIEVPLVKQRPLYPNFVDHNAFVGVPDDTHLSIRHVMRSSWPQLGYHLNTDYSASGRYPTPFDLGFDLRRGTYQLVPRFGETLVRNITETIEPPRPRVYSQKDRQGYPSFTVGSGNILRVALPEKGFRLGGTMNIPVSPGAISPFSPNRQRAPATQYGTISWQLVPVGEEMLEVVIDARDYKTWIPVGGTDEKHAGSYLQVEARLQRTDGKPPVRRARRFTFALNEVSKEPGICMNWPKRDLALATPDLAFESGTSRLIVEDSQGQRGRTADGQFLGATAIVSAFDYGAYGELTVTAEMEDGELIEGHVVGQPTQAGLLIPRRWAGSKIADAWKESSGVVGLADSDDSETEPVGDGFAGDGLALYEEYRGLRMEFGQWRTDPKTKDYFVRDDLRIGTTEAFTYFDKLSGFAVRRIAEDAHENRVINFNYSPEIAALRRCNQHLVILRSAQSAFDASVEGAGGYTSAPTSRNGRVTPQDVDYICIFATPGEMKDVVEPGSDGALRTVRADYYKIAIVHELLHSVNVKHHGAGDRKNAAWSAAADGTTVLENGQAVKVSLESSDNVPYRAFMLQLPLPLTVAVQNGAFSGDQTCVMRYANPLAYIYPGNGSDQRIWLGMEPSEALGMLLCANKSGTGVNGPAHPPWPRYGDAAVGACRTQMRVSDVEGQ